MKGKTIKKKTNNIKSCMFQRNPQNCHRVKRKTLKLVFAASSLNKQQ
jgi:hypothetical protein